MLKTYEWTESVLGRKQGHLESLNPTAVATKAHLKNGHIKPAGQVSFGFDLSRESKPYEQKHKSKSSKRPSYCFDCNSEVEYREVARGYWESFDIDGSSHECPSYSER